MSNAVAKEDRPPYFTFSMKAVEDRNASIESGHYVARDVAYVSITQIGSRDMVEREAEKWLVQCRQQMSDGRLPAPWLREYEMAYKEWKAGNEIPLNGTPIKTWPVASPAQQKMLEELKVRTVEDLAQLTEEGVSHMGIGARSLIQKANEWLESAQSVGISSEKLHALGQENVSLKERITSLEEQLQALMIQVSAEKKPGMIQKLTGK